MSVAESFLDTNIFVYQLDRTDARKSKIAARLVDDAVTSGGAWISFQVVQEFLNTALRKAEIKLGAEAAHAYLENVLGPLCRVPPSLAIYHRSLDVQVRYRLSYYDALIVAAAQEAGCTSLVSEDFQDGQKFDRLTVINPFRASA